MELINTIHISIELVKLILVASLENGAVEIKPNTTESELSKWNDDTRRPVVCFNINIFIFPLT